MQASYLDMTKVCVRSLNRIRFALSERISQFDRTYTDVMGH